ncbi:MAG: MoxR family ATPase [Lachnospiraceae bacterium]|nr:MoxR family ATPase [Lachnospiraceae bacterium]
MNPTCDKILSEVKKAVSGKDDVLFLCLSAILSNGHILIEDIPGVGKTTIALAFSKAMSLDYGRVQFNPDVLPSDITGFSVYKKDTGSFEFTPGAVFSNLFLADELNRATSRTQSALLEAMEEGQVTVDGITHPLPAPFIVIATQNPTGAAGTQFLPDSEVDRFSLRLTIGYPSLEAERELLKRRQGTNPLSDVKPVVSRDTILLMQNAVSNVFVHQDISNYIISLVRATREHENVIRGASPRATLSLTSLSKAVAFLYGRDFVAPSDVRKVLIPAVAHRILPDHVEDRIKEGRKIVESVFERIPAPKV